MAELNVPPDVISDLEAIAKLDSRTLEKILEVLRTRRPSLSPTGVANLLPQHVEGLTASDAQAINDCIIALELARTAMSISTSQLADDVVKGAGSKIADTKQQALKSWLQEVLGIEPLMISAKGISLMQDNERTFFNARVISEIRPVYKEGLSETPKEPPSAAVIVHNLKIAFREAGRYQEFFVTLDSDDITKLKETLERAAAKTETLQALLKSARVSYLTVEGENI